MTVYVDKHCHWTRERCHMIADSHEELTQMARRLGVPQDSIQYFGTGDEHFDITMSKRELALALGAIEMTNEDFRTMQKARPGAKQP
jgi:hypothetical protein